MATETKSSSIPELTFPSRVASIPLVSSSLDTIHTTLSQNTYLSSPYSTAKGFASSAWGYTAPIQVRLAPLTTRADGYANKGLDAVESRFPYPFKAKPEEITGYVRERRQSAMSVANKTIDEKVKSPAYGVAQGIDQRFAPIVDYFEVQVNKLNSEAGPSSPTSDSTYQYQRAYALSRNLTENLYVYSNEHFKQLQAQNSLVQRATQTAHSITDLASSSLSSAAARIHTLSDSMLAELHSLQSSIATLPQALRSTFPDLSATVDGLRNIIAQKDVPLNEKAGKVGAEVRESVQPVLAEVTTRVKELVGGKKAEAEKVVNGYTNGNGDEASSSA